MLNFYHLKHISVQTKLINRISSKGIYTCNDAIFVILILSCYELLTIILSTININNQFLLYSLSSKFFQLWFLSSARLNVNSSSVPSEYLCAPGWPCNKENVNNLKVNKHFFKISKFRLNVYNTKTIHHNNSKTLLRKL